MDYTQFLTDLYKNELGRSPDPEGLSGWTNVLASGQMTPEQVAAQISGSNEGVIYDAYKRELGRAPDAAGMKSWSEAISAGRTTPSEIGSWLQRSDEYGQLGVNQYGDLIRQQYQEELGRAPDQPGLLDWGRALRSGRATPDTLGSYFTNSNERYIKDLYKNYLGRDMDAGAADWHRGLEEGRFTREDVLRGILNSPEYKVKQSGGQTSGIANESYFSPQVGTVSAFTNYSPMRAMPDPRSQPFGFLYDTIQQRLGNNASLPNGLLGLQSLAQSSALGQPASSGLLNGSIPATTGVVP